MPAAEVGKEDVFKKNILLNQDTARGLFGAAVSGSATFGLLKFLQSQGVHLREFPTLHLNELQKQLLITGAFDLVGGVIIYLISSKLSEREKRNYESYFNSRKNFELFKESAFSKLSVEVFKTWLHSEKNDLNITLKKGKELIELLQESQENLEIVIANIKESKKTWKKRLHQESKKLLEIIDSVVSNLSEKITIVDYECEYEKAHDLSVSLG